MSNLSSAEIPEQTFEGTGLENHEMIVQATGEELDHVLMIGGMKQLENEDDEEEEKLYYAKKGDSDNIYLIREDQKDELQKQIWQLR